MSETYDEMGQFQEEESPRGEVLRPHYRKEITMERRLVMLHNAEKLAHFIVNELDVQPNELCLLREMTELLLPARY